MFQIASVFAKPVLDKLGVSDEAKERFVALQKAVTGDAGTAWIPLSRPSATLDFSTHQQTESSVINSGSVETKDGPVNWTEFVWDTDQHIKDCILHKVS
ncbi:hypothetical protein [Roseibium sp.]|uniref:hypothetical protein n=1 Tax=Roseibium sp. TaxID=1936156 RepID=UPI003B509D66